MHYVLTYISLFFTVLIMQGQTETLSKNNEIPSSKYEKGMQEAFKLWQSNKSWDAANMFERIAKAEPDNWVPSYYVAQINIINSFSEKDKTKLTEQLKKAQNFINDATAISKENPDLMVLQAQLYTAWIVFDGMQYGMEYSPKASQLYDKALALSPNNPRMIMAKAEWDIGSAKYFGQSVTAYCEEIKRAIELSKNYKVEGAFYPTFSENRAEQVLAENCK